MGAMVGPHFGEAKKEVKLKEMAEAILDARTKERETNGPNSRMHFIFNKIFSLLVRMDDNEVKLILKRKAKPL